VLRLVHEFYATQYPAALATDDRPLRRKSPLARVWTVYSSTEANYNHASQSNHDEEMVAVDKYTGIRSPVAGHGAGLAEGNACILLYRQRPDDGCRICCRFFECWGCAAGGTEGRSGTAGVP
jgi:hypothetical protein